MKYAIASLLWAGLATALLAPGPAQAQSQTCTLKLTAQLVDKNLNLKPVPKLKLSAREPDTTRAHHFVTGFDGNVEIQLPCGTYQIATETATEFEGKQYGWDIKVTLAPDVASKIELSNDNATSTPVVPEAPIKNSRLKKPASACLPVQVFTKSSSVEAPKSDRYASLT